MFQDGYFPFFYQMSKYFKLIHLFFLQFQPNLSYAFVQQIYVRSAVIPWTPEMQLVDALRGPLDILFELIESISNYQQHNNK